MTVAEPTLNDPYGAFRRSLLSSEELRVLSQLEPARVIRDIALLWAQIVAAWVAVAMWPHWWVVVLAVVVIGTRNYALHVIGHDGIHRRLHPDPKTNDLLNDLLVFGPECAITHLNGQNHMLHHRLLANDVDPDRHKYTSSDKTTWWQMFLYLTGLRGLGPLWRNVFLRERVKAKREGSYSLRDLLILLGWQSALIVGLTLGIGWWAYPVLWMLPVYVFTYCGDQIRFFLEHAHPEPDETADQKRLITYTSNPLERALFAPMNMNYHAVHHLWTSIPYYNLRIADEMVRQRPEAAGMIWRKSYVAALGAYLRALPLPDCRR